MFRICQIVVPLHAVHRVWEPHKILSYKKKFLRRRHEKYTQRAIDYLDDVNYVPLTINLFCFCLNYIHNFYRKSKSIHEKNCALYTPLKEYGGGGSSSSCQSGATCSGSIPGHIIIILICFGRFMKDNALRGIKNYGRFIRCAFHHTLVNNMMYLLVVCAHGKQTFFFIERNIGGVALKFKLVQLRTFIPCGAT